MGNKLMREITLKQFPSRRCCLLEALEAALAASANAGVISRGVCFFLAAARRSVFFQRLARLFALSLPWLFPTRLNLPRCRDLSFFYLSESRGVPG